MVSVLFFQTLAEADTQLVRLALRLCRDFELSKFRALDIGQLMVQYRSQEIANDLDRLCALGFLERGPVAIGRRKRASCRTFRIRPAHLLSEKDLDGWFADRKAESERMAISPDL